MLTNGNSRITASVSVSCPDTARPCDNTTDLFCYNDGLCCEKLFDNSKFCACPHGYSGEVCDVQDMLQLLESRDKAMRVIGVSSGVSVAVGLIALFALGVVTFVIVRSSRNRRSNGMARVDPEKNLDKTIVFVQEEISKLSTVHQLNKLHRLSKVFEKTAREAILSESGHRVERLTSVAENGYLRRCSSAPTCINRPPNDLYVIDGSAELDDVFQQTTLQQVFSLQL